MKMNIKNKMQKGFTLIELMITVAIVGILAAVALPAYQDYTIKAQVSEAMMLSGGATTAVTESFANDGVLAAPNYTTASGKYVASVAVAAGTTGEVTTTFKSASPTNSAIYGKTIIMTPTAGANGIITWVCSGTVDAKYRPAAC